MKALIVKAINKTEFDGRQPEALIGLIFDDLLVMLRFIHWSQKEGLLRQPFLFSNQIEYLDKCWHQFILHSRYYWDFCFEEFGEYLHHFPDEENPTNTVFSENHALKEVLGMQMSLVEQYLGKDFANRVFFLYPEILNREQANEV